MSIAIKLEVMNLLGACNACVDLSARLKDAVQEAQYPADQHHEAFAVAFRELKRARAMLPDVQACLERLRDVDRETFDGLRGTVAAIGNGVPSDASAADLVAGLGRFLDSAQIEVEAARAIVLGSPKDAPTFTCDLSSLAHSHATMN